jgi:DEAD/DEAH box helicase domain-containing protein
MLFYGSGHKVPLVMPIDHCLTRLRRLEKRGEITAWIQLPAREGQFADFPDSLDPVLVQALHSRKVRRLYSHQEAAFRLVGEGKNIVIVTPTASGKTLCYNLPVLQAMHANPESRAIYLFPTKALAQDQMAELQEFIALAGLKVGVHTYDGDTPADMRRRIREQAQIILTNPDMLHTAILPHHPKWAQVFRNLRYLVVDELHTYRGIFGSHVSNVFRRFRRVAEFYNSRFQFISASATISNPVELAAKLLGEAVECVEQSGSPQAAKNLIFYNPPLINPELGLRRSALSASRMLAETFLRENVQTLVFATSRVNVEVLLSYLQKALHRHPADKIKVRGYRGGYLPKTRRQIEKELRDGEIQGVVSTNALELGIDIGSLEACILAGYPGSIASAWQQIGRAGRRNGTAAALLVARNLPLDQFIVTNPDYFLGQSPENALINPDNLQILVSHIKCAAFELPFRKGEAFGGEDLEEILNFLVEQGMLTRSGEGWHWTSESYPADSISLRNIADENFVVFDLEKDCKSIAEVDFDSAPELIHKDAIYMCEGRQYHVDNLDFPGRKAYVRPVHVDYYTEAITYSGLRILRRDGLSQEPNYTVEHGEVHLVKKFPGYKKIKFYSSENLGYGQIHLPLHELHTTAFWASIPEETLAPLGLARSDVIFAFLGLSYAMQNLGTLTVMCDIRDLGRSVGDRSARWFAQAGREGLGLYSSTMQAEEVPLELLDAFEPTVFLYDNCPGGVGFSEKLFDNQRPLLTRTKELIRGCSCRHGCPSCVGPVEEVGRKAKGLSLAILDLLIPPPRPA